MRYLAIAIAMLVAAPAFAQEEAPDKADADYLFTVDVGPGFFKVLDDSTNTAAVEAYIALAWHPHYRFALGARMNATTEPGETSAKITGAPWVFLRGYLTGIEGGLRTYLELSASTAGTVSLLGGAELGFGEGVAAFATVEGRRLTTEEAEELINNDLLGFRGGLRAGWGSR